MLVEPCQHPVTANMLVVVDSGQLGACSESHIGICKAFGHICKGQVVVILKCPCVAKLFEKGIRLSFRLSVMTLRSSLKLQNWD